MLKRRKQISVLFLFCFLSILYFVVAGQRGRRSGPWVVRGSGLLRYSRGNVEITNGTLTSSGSHTVSSGDITATIGDVVASAGDIQAVLGDLVTSAGNVVIPSGEIIAADQIWSIKTVVKTISVVAAASIDDFQFDDTQVNNNEQFIDLGVLVPVWGELVSAQVRCIESYVSSEANPDDIISLDIGISSGTDGVLATDTIDDVDDFITTGIAGSPLVAATAAAKNIWINMQPEDNFDTITAGRWAVIITYIDNGAAYTNAAP